MKGGRKPSPNKAGRPVLVWEGKAEGVGSVGVEAVGAAHGTGFASAEGTGLVHAIGVAEGGRKRRAAGQKARGRPSAWPLVREEAIRRLLASDKAALERRGRPDFLEELEKWLRKTHPDARRMKDKTIGDRLREDVGTRALLPKAWLRRR